MFHRYAQFQSFQASRRVQSSTSVSGTSAFREFSKRRNDARIEEFAHCNEPRVIVGLKQSRLAI
jgi:hypothetical protein